MLNTDCHNYLPIRENDFILNPKENKREREKGRQKKTGMLI